MNSSNFVTYSWVQMADAQDIFNRVARHLLHQGKKAIAEDGGRCVYRNVEDDTTCAAGCLIDPKMYSTDLEGSNWSSLVEDEKVSGNYEDLISHLQVTHDSYAPDEWPSRLKYIAKQHNLTWPV